MLRGSSPGAEAKQSDEGYRPATDAQLHQPSAEKKPDTNPESGWKEAQRVNARASDGPETAAAEFSEDSGFTRQLRIKDLDSGREYNVPQKFTIRDLNTGQVFALSSDSGDPTAPEAAAACNRVTDFASGKQLSLEEFDIALGLAKKESPCKDGSFSSRGGASRPGVEGVGSSGKGLPSKKRAWLKRIRFGKTKTAAVESEASDSDTSASSHREDTQSPLSRNSGAASVSGRTPVRVHRKLYKELAGLSHVQSLQAHNGVVWAMKFSHNGRYLATAGQDCSVHIWEVAAHRGTKQTTESGDPSAPQQQSNGREKRESPEAEDLVFNAAPVRTYKGHKQDVLDVAWSKTLFLLTASMDKSVRLWHVSMDDCLRTFRHTDFVTALDFHPVDDKHFVSGSIDGKVRIWNIPEQNGRVVDYADVHEMVTATTFSADGRRAIIGTMKGKCRFYQCSPDFKLEYEAQIDVKNRRGKASRGRKITGLQFLPNDSAKLLITSNDSRIRLYDGYSLRCKYKGLHNTNTQIRASFSQHGDYIICGSDDGSVYFWTTDVSKAAAGVGAQEESAKGEKSGSYESFHAHDDIATVAIFAPDATKRPLRHSNSPKVREKVVSATEAINRTGLRGKFSKDEVAEAAEAGEDAIKKARAHGQIMLTAGYNGDIKVFENLAPPHWL